jgi:prepilin-type N-terminal cleavage/methylation domain-containing protein
MARLQKLYHEVMAFTLIEFVVVLGIIGLVLAIALPAIFSVQAASRRAECGKKRCQVQL